MQLAVIIALLLALAIPAAIASSSGSPVCNYNDPSIAQSTHGPVTSGNGGYTVTPPTSYTPGGAAVAVTVSGGSFPVRSQSTRRCI